MMAQQAQALDALEKVSQLDKAMESNGNSDTPMPAVGQNEVCNRRYTFSFGTDKVGGSGRI